MISIQPLDHYQYISCSMLIATVCRNLDVMSLILCSYTIGEAFQQASMLCYSKHLVQHFCNIVHSLTTLNHYIWNQTTLVQC